MSIADMVVRAHDLLDSEKLPHAFGGALALGYYADPRGTLDIDINVFCPFETSAAVVSSFDTIGYTPEGDRATWDAAAGVRLRPVDEIPAIDLFFNIDHRYQAIEARTRHLPFGDRILPFLSVDDLIIFKLSFGRPQDWADLEKLAAYRPLDLDWIEDILIGMRGPTMYRRLARFKQIVRRNE